MQSLSSKRATASRGDLPGDLWDPNGAPRAAEALRHLKTLPIIDCEIGPRMANGLLASLSTKVPADKLPRTLGDLAKWVRKEGIGEFANLPFVGETTCGAVFATLCKAGLLRAELVRRDATSAVYARFCDALGIDDREQKGEPALLRLESTSRATPRAVKRFCQWVALNRRKTVASVTCGDAALMIKLLAARGDSAHENKGQPAGGRRKHNLITAPEQVSPGMLGAVTAELFQHGLLDRKHIVEFFGTLKGWQKLQFRSRIRVALGTRSPL